MAVPATIPVLTAEGNLSRYLQEIRKFPMLEPEREFMLAKRWTEHEDLDAVHVLVDLLDVVVDTLAVAVVLMGGSVGVELGGHARLL